MAKVGASWKGEQIGLDVDTSLGTQIGRYEVVQISENTTTDNQMMIGLCNTDSTGRGLGFGVALRDYPYVPQIHTPDGRAISDISNFDPNTKKTLATRLEGTSWFRVKIPLGGDDVSISNGDRLVPSVQSPGGVEPIPAPTMTGATDVATIVAAYAADEFEQNAVIAKALTPIFILPDGETATSIKSWTGPSIKGWTPVATLTADTQAATYGYVFGKLGKG